LASSFFFSSASTFDGVLASSLSFASASGVDVSSSFVAVSVWLLYHLDLGDNVDRKEFMGAAENRDRTNGRWATILELEEITLDDEVNACLNIVAGVLCWETAVVYRR
jgi:hypothetical protein